MIARNQIEFYAGGSLFEYEITHEKRTFHSRFVDLIISHGAGLVKTRKDKTSGYTGDFALLCKNDHSPPRISPSPAESRMVLGTLHLPKYSTAKEARPIRIACQDTPKRGPA